MTQYDFEVELPTRFRDIDVMGHVNNAVYATFVEQARVKYLAEVAGADLESAGLVIADLEIDFRRPIDFGETVIVGVGATEVGSASMTLEYEVLADGELAAEAETVFVHVDPETGKSTSMPDAWRDRVRTHEGQ